ncbi:MAG: hypothetical protein RL681_238 [Candidatus Parcubacteria bacterium]|jgi:hypothetical protein
MIKTIEQRLAELEARVTSLEKRAAAPHESDTDSRLPPRKKMSAKEFLMTKTFKSELEKTLVLVYHLEHVEGMLSFNVNDVVGVFRAAKEKKPVNPNDAVAKNVARGFLMDAAEKKEGKKAWTLTATGERYVEQELGK